MSKELIWPDLDSRPRFKRSYGTKGQGTDGQDAQCGLTQEKEKDRERMSILGSRWRRRACWSWRVQRASCRLCTAAGCRHRRGFDARRTETHRHTRHYRHRDKHDHAVRPFRRIAWTSSVCTTCEATLQPTDTHSSYGPRACMYTVSGNKSLQYFRC